MTQELNPYTIIIIGGGAAGFFAAIAAAQAAPSARVLLLEKARQLLSKVRISGGGRCNVTHACFEPKQLICNYPRGGKALLGPFSRFQPKDTIQWFQQRGVTLKTEDDGRMFPITDNSETIIQCLLSEARRHRVEIQTEIGLEDIIPHPTGFDLQLTNGTSMHCDRLLLASGSNSKIWNVLQKLGHTIVPPVPSLFTFNIPSSPLLELAGISVEHAKVKIKIKDHSLEQTGPLLITHWGFSGPAVLKLSAWGARLLHDNGYRATLLINWIPNLAPTEVKTLLQDFKMQHPAKMVANENPTHLSRNLWKKLIERANVPPSVRWSHLASKQMDSIIKELTAGEYLIEGKTTYKEEFVTCGGIQLDEVNFKTMESKKVPHLHFAGEILDIDGVTGGFNFQNAWTTGLIAGTAMGSGSE